MSGCRGRLCWTCGSERAREAEIEVLCHPRTDYFSRSLKDSRLYAREVAINDARGKDLRSITERWSSRSRATRLMPESQESLPPPPIEDGGASKTRLNSCASRGGVRTLSISTYGRGLGGGPLDAPFCTMRPCHASHPQQRAELMPLARLHPPVQGKLYTAILSPPERRWEFFLSEASFFSPWATGVF